jgi:hypothetical protein
VSLHPSGQKPRARPEPARTGRGPSPARRGSVTKSAAGRPLRARSAGHRGISRPPTDSLTPAGPLLNSSRHRHSRPPSKGWRDGLSDHPFSGLSIRRRAVLPGVSMSRAPPGPRQDGARRSLTPYPCCLRGPRQGFPMHPVSSDGHRTHRVAPRTRRQPACRHKSAAQSRGGTITSQSAGNAESRRPVGPSRPFWSSAGSRSCADRRPRGSGAGAPGRSPPARPCRRPAGRLVGQLGPAGEEHSSWRRVRARG